MNKKKNNLLNWLFEEGIIEKEGNVYIAERAFLANTFVNWIQREAKNKNLSPKDVEKKMNILRLFLKKQVDLEWHGEKIRVIKKPLLKKKREREMENYKINKDVV